MKRLLKKEREMNWFKRERLSALPPKRPIVINLATNVQPAHTALILFTSFDGKEIQDEVEKLVKANNNVIPSDLPYRLQRFGDVFTEWEGILIDVEPTKPMMNISTFGPVS
jgi:hypothetical protein